jgi:hypothetical protein
MHLVGEPDNARDTIHGISGISAEADPSDFSKRALDGKGRTA